MTNAAKKVHLFFFLFFFEQFLREFGSRNRVPVVLSRCHRVQDYKERAIYANHLQQFAIKLL
jgi:hypothetical protein